MIIFNMLWWEFIINFMGYCILEVKLVNLFWVFEFNLFLCKKDSKILLKVKGFVKYCENGFISWRIRLREVIEYMYWIFFDNVLELCCLMYDFMLMEWKEIMYIIFSNF